MRKHKLLSERKKRICELDAESIAFYRRNPCIACEELLGIKLIDSQKYILQASWNKSHVLWCCSRNFGKSFLGAIFMVLKAILYENQAIYIVSSVGDQSKETFSKIEEIVLRIGKTSASIDSLKDIVEKETKKSSNNKTGFGHSQSGFHVEFYNGSEIFTLNGNPDNNRSRRATLVFFDEAAFSSDELIAVCEAFATQNTEFKTSIDKNFNPETLKRKCPTQLVYASSQDDMSKLFYRHYKNFAKKMLAGDRDYLVVDMICDTAIKTFMEGKPYPPLLTQDKVDAAMKSNREKALREYYNQPTRDGGVNQIVKWGTIRRNESFYLPQLSYKSDSNIILAFDPARTIDNSILGAMSVVNHPDYGYIGEIVNCVNLFDKASKKGFKLDSNRQIAEIRKYLSLYNGHHNDYVNIDSLLIDQGSGGGGVSTYGDGLLNDWVGDDGRSHRGLIDSSHEIYAGYKLLYPNAIDKLRLISPRKYRTQMVDEFIELIDLGVIKFPYEFKQETISIAKKQSDSDEEIIEKYELSESETSALVNIDLMKTETTSIYKYENAEKTTKTYALAKDKENTMHDDRFYVLIMLAHRLYELRRGQVITSETPKVNYSSAPLCSTGISFD
ncbi:terminase family protein [Clostridium sp. HBUAS56010]|uniref:terminase large subunit domain-containing protein n=1 Tax=Clostridium sp. HBUAS56010 TaxID=2571127 RepID=UPI0011773957|nr:terminase family protein [Clostridium sp. HBUAS56010]